MLKAWYTLSCVTDFLFAGKYCHSVSSGIPQLEAFYSIRLFARIGIDQEQTALNGGPCLFPGTSSCEFCEFGGDECMPPSGWLKWCKMKTQLGLGVVGSVEPIFGCSASFNNTFAGIVTCVPSRILPGSLLTTPTAVRCL